MQPAPCSSVTGLALARAISSYVPTLPYLREQRLDKGSLCQLDPIYLQYEHVLPGGIIPVLVRLLLELPPHEIDTFSPFECLYYSACGFC